VEGGVLIEAQGPSVYGDCTLGFNARYKGVPVFVVNAHCTGKIGQVERTRFGQPILESFLGYETDDPPFSLNAFANPYLHDEGVYVSCSTQVNCRRADVALVSVEPGVNVSLGHIARPKRAIEGLYANGTKEIDTRYPQLVITGEDGQPDMNEELDKVGKSTGWTYGKVSRICVNLRTIQNVVLRCQHFVKAGAQTGDSGSPVFKWKTGGVLLHGILWGGRDGGFWYSSLDMIRLDLGLQTTDRTNLKVF
jgi:hypothetical protein